MRKRFAKGKSRHQIEGFAAILERGKRVPLKQSERANTKFATLPAGTDAESHQIAKGDRAIRELRDFNSSHMQALADPSQKSVDCFFNLELGDGGVGVREGGLPGPEGG